MKKLRHDFPQIRRILLCLFALLLFCAKAQAQYSVYDRLTGVVPQFSHFMPPLSQNRYLVVKLHSRYDNVIKAATADGNFEFARWSVGTSVDWRISENQRWSFELLRATEILRASSVDSSWRLNNVQKQNHFRVAHHRAFGRFPISMLSFFQIYTQNNRTLYNYGVGVRGRIDNYTFDVASEYKNWSPFYQAFLNSSPNSIGLFFPTLANIRQITWSVSGESKGIYLESYIRTGSLISSNRHENDYTFRPSGEVRTFMVLLQKKPLVNSQVRLSFLWEQIHGDGVLRFRDRKYGNLNLNNSHFSDARLAITRMFKKTSIKVGIAHQRLSGKANANIQAWPFDNSSVDFFKAKQSLTGAGNLNLMRGWLQTDFNSSRSFQTTLLLEYIHATLQSRMKTRGSALLFVSGEIGEHHLDRSQDFIRIGVSLRLVLSKKLDVNLKINQWAPLAIKVDPNSITRAGKGGTFGQIVLGFYL